jgi:hypothetical protein
MSDVSHTFIIYARTYFAVTNVQTYYAKGTRRGDGAKLDSVQDIAHSSFVDQLHQAMTNLKKIIMYSIYFDLDKIMWSQKIWRELLDSY